MAHDVTNLRLDLSYSNAHYLLFANRPNLPSLVIRTPARIALQAKTIISGSKSRQMKNYNCKADEGQRTLRTYQRAGCDDEVVTLKCPPGTSISIEIAQYGKTSTSESLCSPRSTASPISRTSYNFNVSSSEEPHSSCTRKGWLLLLFAVAPWERLKFILVTHLLYSPEKTQKTRDITNSRAGETVVETCQKKRQCKFQTNTKTFGGDPCPGIRKYVEVAYKCRPYEFRSKVACENERIQLKCNPNSRVAVYSASYGRTEYESIQCPQPQGVPEETCLVSYATETVMQLCHGKGHVTLQLTSVLLEAPVSLNLELPRKVLKDQYDGGLEKDETDVDTANYEEDDFDIYDAGNEYIRESAASPPAPNVEGIAKDNFTKRHK
ncbi:hypothetical protein NQ317_014860 [Molorchus minor]|uniref:SUEL-type lectin domain-containing protein n=1 Tax=Molorchus minor TaxID=1323400 RepID=A0ABQ9J4Q6_9CUCU|nr:hypothetical protein NQ317_014860 [Molorchus minor]